MTTVDDVLEVPASVTDDTAAAPEAGPLTDAQVASQLSLLLQHLLDCLPDDAVTAVRRALARDDLRAAAGTLLFSLVRHRSVVMPVELAVLEECVEAVGGSTTLLDHVLVADTPRPAVFEVRAALPAGDDVSGTAPGEGAQEREGDHGVLERLVGVGSVHGVWRGWRVPVDSAWPAPRLVHLVEVDDEGSLRTVHDRFHDVTADLLRPPGRTSAPLVEAYLSGRELPPHLRAVQLDGRLVHVGRVADFEFCDVFEGAPGADGLPQHVVRVDGDEADRMAGYLGAGRLLMAADAAGDDLFRDDGSGTVPLDLRTDGHWIWSEASLYYLLEHGIAPPGPLREAIARSPGLPSPVPDAVLHQAVRWLQEQAGDDASGEGGAESGPRS